MRAGPDQAGGRRRAVPRPAARHAADGGRRPASSSEGRLPIRHAAGPYPSGEYGSVPRVAGLGPAPAAVPVGYPTGGAVPGPAPSPPLPPTEHMRFHRPPLDEPGGIAPGPTAAPPPGRVDHRHTADDSAHRPSTRGSRGGVIGATAEVVVVVGLALILALVVKTFLVQAFYIPSESMETTLLVGDRVLVSKLTPSPFALHRGDVVVFQDPGGWLDPESEPRDDAVRHAVRSTLTFVGLLPQDSGEHLIKRVIGLPGDKVACCDAQGRLTVDGVPVDERYLRQEIAPSTTRFSATVPAGRLWVMGDNRPFSEDSRYHPDLAGGTVPVSDVVGRAFGVVWPFTRAGGVTGAGATFDDVPTSDGGS